MKLAIMLALMAVCGQAQGQNPAQMPLVEPAAPVLKCGQYQHVERGGKYCHVPDACDPDTMHCLTLCTVAEDRCMDDIHVVTEREWQELMARLAKSQSDAKKFREAGLNAAKIAEDESQVIREYEKRMAVAYAISEQMKKDLQKAKP